MRRALWLVLAVVLASACGCSVKPGTELARRGDEIMVCGRLFHTGAPVVLWTDPGGYDAYRTEKRFVPFSRAAWAPAEKSSDGPGSPNRYGLRFAPRGDDQVCVLSPDELEQVRGGGWDLDLLGRHVDQFVLHYDVCGTSRQCFRVLHDVRGLSVHFLLDIDGTIYQTMDLKERAWHATTANDRSVGVEIANIGAYPPGASPLDQWYQASPDARTRITLPERMGDGGIRTPGFVGYPARDEPITGEIQGRTLRQYDLTDQQYDSLIRLTAALHRVLPAIELDYPRDEQGLLVTKQLSDEHLTAFRGVLGHYHIQKDKTDPGPALQWDKVVNGARWMLGLPRLPEGDRVNAPGVSGAKP